MPVMKIIYRSPGSHDKVIYMSFCYMPTRSNQVCKLQFMVESEISSLLNLIFYSSVTRVQVAWRSWWWFGCSLFEPRKRKCLSLHRLLVRKFNICEIHHYVMQPDNQYPRAASLIFYIKNLCFKHLYTPLLIMQQQNVQYVLRSIPSYVQSLWQFRSTMKKNVSNKES